MSSSPFELFRRNLKPLMIALTGLAMFAFVVLPVLDSYMRQSAGSGAEQVVAKVGSVNLTRGRVESFTRGHNMTVTFLRDLAQTTLDNGEFPATAGFNYDKDENGRNVVTTIGINETPSAFATVRTIQFAEQAMDAGFNLDDVAIRTWLEQFTAGVFSERQINGMLVESTNNQMGKYHLYEQLRFHLLADLYLRGAMATVRDGRMPLLTPSEHWAMFLKLNQKATVDSYGVLVNDYLDKTNKDPSPQEISAVYEEGKDRYPNEQSPDPGFRRRYGAKFEYLVGDYQTFLDVEVAKYSEDALRAEYERRLKGGDFQLPAGAIDSMELPEDPLDSGSGPAEGEASENEENAAENAKPQGDSEKNEGAPDDGQGESGESDGDNESAAKETSPTQGDQSEETSKAEASAEASEEQASGDSSESGEDAAPAEAYENSETPEEVGNASPEADQQSRRDGSRATRLVALQEAQEESTESESTESEPAQKSAESESEAESTEAESTEAESTGTPGSQSESPAESESGDQPTEDDQPDNKGSDPTSAEATSDADDGQQPKNEKAGETSSETSEGDGETGGENEPASQPEPKVETFEDVRDRIAEDLAGPAARAKMDSAVTEIYSAMRLYFNQRAIHESNVMIGVESEAPEPLDLKALGEKLGFKHEVIGPFDEVTIANEPISETLEVGTIADDGRIQRGPAFGYMMFGIQTPQGSITPLPLYSPLRTTNDVTRKTYVSWKLEAPPHKDTNENGEIDLKDEKVDRDGDGVIDREYVAYTPDIDECRDEVVLAIRTREARKLALEAAEQLAKRAAEEGKTLAELIPEDRKDNLKEGLGPFSWLDSFGFQGATIGNVPQLDSVGEEFMKAVFETKVDDYGVALNQPQRVVYVVRPRKFDPSLEDLQVQFKQPMNRMMAQFVGGADGDKIIQGFYKTLDERTGFESSIQP